MPLRLIVVRYPVPMHLIKYLNRVFPQLDLAPALFHQWTVGLRFELGAEGPPETYFSRLEARAKSLYETAFSPQDTCYLATVELHIAKDRRRIPYEPGLFAQARKQDHGLGRPSGRARARVDSESISTTRWAQFTPGRLDIDWILGKISHEDFPVGAGFPGETYLINFTRGLIFHMYDDRGLDIIAARRETLQPIFDTHRPWLLSYNLERMEAMFLSAATA
jgi:hypothetical protein